MARYRHFKHYKHYQHMPLGEAHADSKTDKVKRYQVTTYTTKNGKVDRSKVHRNEYTWTLQDLIRFLRQTEDVVLDIIEIQPEPAGSNLMPPMGKR